MALCPHPKYVPAWTYRTNVPYFSLIFKAYHTNVQYPGTRTRDGNRPGRPAGRVEILRPAGQAGWKTGQILISGN